MIKELLGDCPSEEATIIIDIESNILNLVLELLNESRPTFPSRLLGSVKEALKLFKIDNVVLGEEVRSQPRKLSKERKKTVKRLDEAEAAKFDTIQDVDEYEANKERKEKDSVVIDCPYEGCQKKLKKDSYLKHLCLIHYKEELASKLITLESGNFKCPRDLCNLESSNKSFMISHFGIRHNVIAQLNYFPKHNVLNNT